MVPAVYNWVPPTPAKLGCVNTVIPLPTWPQMASPQGHKINNNGRKVDGILSAVSLPGVSQIGTWTLRRSSHKAEISSTGCVWSNSKAGVPWLQAEMTENIPATLQ